MDATDDEVGPIARAIGEELRRTRDDQGLNRSDVVAGATTVNNAQTLANYEYGIRNVTLPRLVDICDQLRVSAADLIGIALQRANVNGYGTIYVDLFKIITADRRPELWVLRAWAEDHVDRSYSDMGVVRVDMDMINALAKVTAIPKVDLVDLLRTFTPDLVPNDYVKGPRKA